MPQVTVELIKQVRAQTGAGMSDVKKALEAADGVAEDAIEALRTSGAAKAVKRAGEREASNGLVAAHEGALITLACETDFVAKSAQVLAFADEVVALVWEKRLTSVEETLRAVLASGRSVEESLNELSATMGEKMLLSAVALVEGQSTVYLHRRSRDLPPQVGVLVSYEGSEEAARDVALQVSSMKAQFVSQTDVPAELVAREQRIAQAQAEAEGKPAAAIPRIVQGRVNAFYKEVVLLDQAFVREPKQTVAQVLQGANTSVKSFVRFEAGA